LARKWTDYGLRNGLGCYSRENGDDAFWTLNHMLTTKQTPNGVTFTIKVLPRSSRNEIVGEQEGMLRVKLTAPPVEGAANKMLVNFIASKLKVSKSSVTILSGETGRTKTISVSGITPEDLAALH